MNPYDNNLHGALFLNDKGDNPKRPDYKGECEIAGVKYWMSGWIAYTPTRVRYMSIRFEAKGAPRPMTPPPARSSPDFDDQIPF